MTTISSASMDPSSPPAIVPPLSPTGSSHSEPSLDEPEYSTKPLPPVPASPLLINHDHHKRDALPALQVAQGDSDGLDPIGEDELDPGSFDLVVPVEQSDTSSLKYKLEKRSELLFSNRHLQSIFDDSAHLYRFSNFLRRYRPASVPLLTYFLDALKALRAIEYSNAVLRQLSLLNDYGFTHDYYQAQHTANPELQNKANAAFDILAREDLPMYITHVWIQTVSVSIRHRIMGTSSNASEGLAEVFCLTDPSRHDNPIVFMSEEFNRTTQYGVDYVIGRNCRFLQGPFTNPFSITRIREKVEAGVEHYETFLNYRRDGSPFMNLVMIAPLYDSRGVIRYFIGAQVDVSGLAMGCYDLGALKKVADEDEQAEAGRLRPTQTTDEFTQLAEILGPHELEIVRNRGGEMHRLPLQSEHGLHSNEKLTITRPAIKGSRAETTHSSTGSRNRVVLGKKGSRDGSDSKQETILRHNAATTVESLAANHNGRLTGVYEHYLLVRPYPSLRILFTSPSMRVPGILQSPLLDRIGGSEHMRHQLIEALANGQSVTAKVRWLTISHRAAASYKSRSQRKDATRQHPLEAHLHDGDVVDNGFEPENMMGRSRWLHCTPLVGSNGKVGVWMIVIVDDESHVQSLGARKHADATVEHKRPESSASDRLETLDRKYRMNSHHKTDAFKGQHKMSRCRSSETLGDGPSSTCVRSEDGSVTKTIHSQHAHSSLRTPRSPHGKSIASAARFYSLEALSRAACARSSTTGVAVPIPTSENDEQGRESERASLPSQTEEILPLRPQLWPKPPQTPSLAQIKKKKRECGIRVPSVIQETSADRGLSWGPRSQESHGSSGETCSLRSKSSALTVKIEEGS
ncbi:hypothetical protein E4U21_002446 [Claviceps maximensis]|nr:hypothetical protein E4U21_002446 [Claviceps maximensis]